MKSKFKVGDVWKTAGGRPVIIRSINNNTIRVQDTHGITWEVDADGESNIGPASNVVYYQSNKLVKEIMFESTTDPEGKRNSNKNKSINNHVKGAGRMSKEIELKKFIHLYYGMSTRQRNYHTHATSFLIVTYKDDPVIYAAATRCHKDDVADPDVAEVMLENRLVPTSGKFDNGIFKYMTSPETIHELANELIAAYKAKSRITFTIEVDPNKADDYLSYIMNSDDPEGCLSRVLSVCKIKSINYMGKDL